MSAQLADKLYREYGLVSIIENGRFVDFADQLEKGKDYPTAATAEVVKKQ